MGRFIVILLMFWAASAFAAPADDLHALIGEYWANEIEEDPFFATGAGVHDENDRVPAVAPEDYARRAEASAAFLARLRAIDGDALGANDRLNAEVLDFILSHKVALAAFDEWRIPFVSDSGFHTEFNVIASTTPFRNEKDYEDYLARLRAFPAFLDQHMDNMRAGLSAGFTQPKAVLENALASFDAQVRDEAEDHPLYAPFEAMPDRISRRRQNALREEGKRALSEDVIPAFARLAAFMKDDYLSGARESLGASSLPDGAAYYEALVRYYTSLDDVTADDIHALGLKEVARIRGEMKAVLKDAAFEGDLDAFMEYLRTDEQFYAKTPEQLLARAARIAKDIDGRLPGFFGKLPRQPYSVEPVPDDIAPNYTTGRYVGAPADAKRGGQYWVNTYGLDKRPLYELPALTLHEAVPGHHLQSALALEIDNAPEFRKEFYPHAFGEGWGLYAEKLGVEMGVYATPYEHFGRLSYEMWRACRLVIDTGIHTKGWTREQAIDFLAANTALSLHNVRTEVDRYISWPGQALSYKMGELTIWELRAKAEKELGDRFDIRAFHDALLADGGLPLETLRRRVDGYIEEAKAP
jgi:uncharacterized protein (DUF885 family)